MASGVAQRLHLCHFRLCLTEIPCPQAVRRGVAFSEAIYDGEKEVEGVIATLVSSPSSIISTWAEGRIPILVDPEAQVRDFLKPDVLIDATMAKRNLGTKRADAPLVIGLGPGFEAGRDVHVVIETNRGHNLGRAIWKGQAELDTGIPGDIAGVSVDRVLRAPQAGRLSINKEIGDTVKVGDTVTEVGTELVKALVSGVVRGLLREGFEVREGMKLGDIDPRGVRENCYTVSDKVRAIAGGVLEAILARFNT